MSFDVKATGYKGMSEGNPAEPVTGNVKQPNQDDKTSGSKLASVVKGISAHCNGVNVQLAPPDLGNPTVASSGRTEGNGGSEKAENKSSGGIKMTVNGTNEGGEAEAAEKKEAEAAPASESKEPAKTKEQPKMQIAGPADQTDETTENNSDPKKMQIAGPVEDETHSHGDGCACDHLWENRAELTEANVNDIFQWNNDLGMKIAKDRGFTDLINFYGPMGNC